MKRRAASAIVLDMDGVLLRTNDAKYRALKHIADRHSNNGIVFFGDSLGDLAAAQSAGVPFVAVTAEWDNFVERTVVKLQDFTDPDTIKRCISEAAQAYAI